MNFRIPIKGGDGKPGLHAPSTDYGFPAEHLLLFMVLSCQNLCSQKPNPAAGEELQPPMPHRGPKAGAFRSRGEVLRVLQDLGVVGSVVRIS